jgi:ribonuclease VapC
MVIDTSAVFAIVLGESERDDFSVAIKTAHRRLISVASTVECVAVFAGRQPGFDALAAMDRFIGEFALEVAAMDAPQWRAAADALIRFGKGRHPARLNLGDSFAYGLAKVTGEPLLFKGGDFALTDIASAI